MLILQTSLLGAIQGLTEFLPISSSGHLVIMQSLISFKEPGILLDVLLHLGTFLSILVFFHKKIFTLILSFFGIFIPRYRGLYEENKKFLWGVVIASIPTAFLGLFLEQFTDIIFNSIGIVGVMLLLTAVMLFITDLLKPKGGVSYFKAFLMGIGQGIAVMPGLSRSGTTIFLALLLNINRREAVEFSFIMSLPAVFGAALFIILKDGSGFATAGIFEYLIGMLFSFIFGLLAIKVMIQLVSKASLKLFGVYCSIVGVSSLVIFMLF